MDAVRFSGRVRYWNPEKASGLTVVDIPAEHVAALDGLRQQHVSGMIGDAPFESNVMPAGGGRLALSVSKAMLRSGRVHVGSDVAIRIDSVGRNSATT